MTKVTYLSHCGFAVTLDKVILVFDYLHDPAHVLKHLDKSHPDLPVIFFISHNLVNNNHFNPGTFEIAQNRRRIYIVSNTVEAKIIPSTLEVQGMSAGDVIEDLPGGISVKAYPTTDKDKYKGVCFMVTLPDGKKIFHGGHLNFWDLPDETTEKETRKNEEAFKTIIDRIASENPEVEVAMFAVNPRISLDYAQGARMLTETIKVKDFFPMDIDGDKEAACDFKVYLPETTTGHCLVSPGESATIK